MISDEILITYEYAHTTFLILSILTNSTLILLILRFSPKRMHSYRPYLLNLTVTNLILSLYADGIVRAAYFSSTNLTILRGPIKCLGHDVAIPAFTILVFLIWWLIFSLTACFLYRYANVARNHFAEALLHFRGIAVVIASGLIFCFGMTILFWLSIRIEYRLLIAYFIPLEPNLLEKDADPAIFGYNKFIAVFGLSAAVSMIFIASIIVTSAIFTVRSLHKYRSSMSANSYRLQTQLTVSLIIQCLYPFLMGLTPLMIIPLYQATGWPSIAKSTDSFMFFVISILYSYPAIDPLITIFLVGPYRMTVSHYIKLILRCGRQVDALDATTENSPISAVFQRRTTIAPLPHGSRMMLPSWHLTSVTKETETRS